MATDTDMHHFFSQGTYQDPNIILSAYALLAARMDSIERNPLIRIPLIMTNTSRKIEKRNLAARMIW